MQSLLSRHELPKGWSKLLVNVLAQVMVVLLGILDYHTGVKFHFAIIYLIPITLAALYGGVTGGVITTLTTTTAWFAADAFGGVNYGTGWMAYWNAFARLTTSFLIVVLLSRGKALNRVLADKAQALTLEVERRKRAEGVYADEKEILQNVALDRPLTEILDQSSRKIERWYAGMRCAIFLFDWEQGRFFCVSAPGLPNELRKEIQQICGAHTFSDASLARTFFEAPASDVAPHPACTSFRQSVSQHQFRFFCSKAILSGSGELLGVLTLLSPDSEGFRLPELALFDKARDITAIAIERTRLSSELRKLSELVTQAQEAERRRIARELHDSVNQILSSVTFRIKSIDAQMPEAHAELKADLARAKELLTKGIDEVHRISDDLRPSELDSLGLLPALRSLCAEFQKKTSLSLKLKLAPSPQRLPDAVELTVYRIIQEALNNIEKHAGASQIVLRLEQDGSLLSLTVHDNGKGLESTSKRLRLKKTGMGLINMRERTAFLGGTFSIQSDPDKGTKIEVKIPLAEPDRKTALTDT